MIKKLVRFRVEPGEIETVKKAIAEFVAAVRTNEPDTIYGSLQAEDGVSFVHAMAFANESAEQRHSGADYTKRFVEVLYPRCEQPPEFTTVTVFASSKKGAGFLGKGG